MEKRISLREVKMTKTVLNCRTTESVAGKVSRGRRKLKMVDTHLIIRSFNYLIIY